MNADALAAANVITDAGQKVTIAGNSASTYNPATGGATATPYTATVYATLLPLSAYRMERDSNIQSGDERMLLSALDVNSAVIAKPPLDSIVTLADGVTVYTMIAVNPLHPSGTDLYFDCVVRGRK